MRPWEIGPSLLDQLDGLPRLSTWHEIPRGGLHLNPATRRATVWSIDPVRGLSDRFADRWPGWTLDFREDRYRESTKAFTFPDPEPAAGQYAYVLADRVAKHWAPGIVEYRDSVRKRRRGQDMLNGTGGAGLTIAALRKFVDQLLEPVDQPRPFDVAAYARDNFGWN